MAKRRVVNTRISGFWNHILNNIWLKFIKKTPFLDFIGNIHENKLNSCIICESLIN